MTHEEPPKKNHFANDSSEAILVFICQLEALKGQLRVHQYDRCLITLSE